VTQNSLIGSRFDIAGFPTIKFLKKGKVYDYSGSRKPEAFISFVKDGYKKAKSEDVPPPKTWFQEFFGLFKEAFNNAYEDIKGGSYLSLHVLILVLPPVVLVLIGLIFCFSPAEEEGIEISDSTEEVKTTGKDIKSD